MNESILSLSPYVVKREPDHVGFPKSPQIVVKYWWMGHDDLPDIYSIELNGQPLTDSTLGFFRRFGFNIEELQEHILNVHTKVDPDFTRD